MHSILSDYCNKLFYITQCLANLTMKKQLTIGPKTVKVEDSTPIMHQTSKVLFI
jgi:hypothetical protein